MKLSRRSAGLIVAALLGGSGVVFAQEVRRALPLNEPPVPRALPVDEGTPALEERPSTPEQPSDTRQLEVRQRPVQPKNVRPRHPGYEKYLSDYPGAPGRGNAYFGLGESYRQLGKKIPLGPTSRKCLRIFRTANSRGRQRMHSQSLLFRRRISPLRSLFSTKPRRSRKTLRLPFRQNISRPVALKTPSEWMTRSCFIWR